MKLRDPIAELGCGGLLILAVFVAVISIVLYAVGVRVIFPWDPK